MDKAKRMIQNAKKEVMISLWRDEFAFLERGLKKIEANGVKVAIVHFGIPDKTIGQMYQHPIEDTLYEEKGGRGFTLVCDGNTALVGTVMNGFDVEGAWSHNLGFVTLAEDYIKHDVYVMKIIKRFDPRLKSTFGKNYFHLRNIFDNKDER